MIMITYPWVKSVPKEMDVVLRMAFLRGVGVVVNVVQAPSCSMMSTE